MASQEVKDTQKKVQIILTLHIITYKTTDFDRAQQQNAYNSCKWDSTSFFVLESENSWYLQ